jgi:hypothetical protein
METIMATVRDTLRSPGSSAVQAAIKNLLFMILGVKRSRDLNELIAGCAPYHSDEVFLEIDRLCRSGHLRLQYKKDGDYAVSLPPSA